MYHSNGGIFINRADEENCRKKYSEFDERQAKRSWWDKLWWYEYQYMSGRVERYPTTFHGVVKGVMYLTILGIFLYGLYLINPAYNRWFATLDDDTQLGIRLMAGSCWCLILLLP